MKKVLKSKSFKHDTNLLSKKLGTAIEWIKKYPVIVVSIVMLGYYLTTTLDLLKKSAKVHFTTLDFILQFDSLFWIWLVAFIFIKFQQAKERYYDEAKEKLFIQLQVEKSKITSKLLKDITRQLQDAINNPLAVIRVMTEDIRKRFFSEPDIMRRLDQIDTSLRRIHYAIKDVATYQTAQALEILHTGIKSEVADSSPSGDNGSGEASDQ